LSAKPTRRATGRHVFAADGDVTLARMIPQEFGGAVSVWRCMAAFGLAVVTVLSALVVGSAPVGAASSHGVVLNASINGHPLATSTENHPIRLYPNTPATVDLQLTNNGSAAVDIRTVEIAGRVIGLTFFSFDTSVDLPLAPQASTTLTYDLDLAGLRGQATGLIPSDLRVLDTNRHALASESMVSDVRGSIRSVYGLFGIVLLLLTGLAFAAALLALARHRLSPNRWWRGVRFLTPGIGLGLVLVFTVSALRLFSPTTGKWVVTVLVSAAVFFVIGYLTPTPVTDDEDADDEGEDPEDAEWTDRTATPAGPPSGALG
jgi:hypothetical protein